MGRTPKGETRRRVFEFVRDRILAGVPPTIREVQSSFGFKTVQTAREHIEGLIEDGKLDKEKLTARGLRLPSHTPAAMIPLLGEVHAGNLALAVEEAGEMIPFERGSSRDYFALMIRGESMRDAGILPGDIAIVRKQNFASDGDIVIALVGDDATIKRLRLRRSRAELHPANPDFRPIVPDELHILGRVVEIRRRLT